MSLIRSFGRADVRSIGRSSDRGFGRSVDRSIGCSGYGTSGLSQGSGQQHGRRREGDVRLRGPAALLIVILGLAMPSAAQAQSGHLGGFGGLTFGDVTSSTTFGGGLAVPLSDNLQIIAEGGRMTDLMPSLLGTVIDVVPIDLRVSAWYGEAGVRLIAPSRRAVRPYAEATGGFARMRTGFAGAGSGIDPFVNGALGLLDRTEPMFGVGGGVLLQGGPVFLDLGYRYKKIVAGDSLQSILTGGDVNVNQVRAGVGIRW